MKTRETTGEQEQAALVSWWISNCPPVDAGIWEILRSMPNGILSLLGEESDETPTSATVGCVALMMLHFNAAETGEMEAVEASLETITEHCFRVMTSASIEKLSRLGVLRYSITGRDTFTIDNGLTIQHHPRAKQFLPELLKEDPCNPSPRASEIAAILAATPWGAS